MREQRKMCKCQKRNIEEQVNGIQLITYDIKYSVTVSGNDDKKVTLLE